MNKTHFTVENIIETLQNIEGVNIVDMCHMYLVHLFTGVYSFKCSFRIEIRQKILPAKRIKQKNKRNFEIGFPFNIVITFIEVTNCLIKPFVTSF